MSKVEIEQKTSFQKRLDIIVILMAVLSTISMIMTTDEVLADGLLIVVPIWLTAITVYLRYRVSNILCIIGLIICILGLIFSPKMIIPCILSCVFFVVALIDTLKANRQNETVREEEQKIKDQEREIELKKRSAVISQIDQICKEYDVRTRISRSSYGDSISVEGFYGNLVDAEAIAERCIKVHGVRPYPEYVVTGKQKKSYTTTSRKTLGEVKIEADYTEVGRMKVKGDVEQLHEYEASVHERFSSVRDAMRFAQTESIGGDLRVSVLIKYDCKDNYLSCSPVAALMVAEFINGAMLQY